jgi:NAD(P)-dependent dehydrogenase (short-subunit alcohol dehydrogenase family)
MRFDTNVVALFAAASRDFSPLHMSDAYARSTPFGRRVVHGACAAMACCGAFLPPPGCVVRRLKAVFYQPVFLNLAYEVKVQFPDPHRASISLLDGSTQVLELVLSFEAGSPSLAVLPAAASSSLATAAVWKEEQLPSPWADTSPYGPGSADYLALLDCLQVQRERWGDAIFTTLMATSYLTGMVMPGERAMYFQLQAELTNSVLSLPSTLSQELIRFDERWGSVTSRFSLASRDSQRWASGEIQAFLRPQPTQIAPLASPVDPFLVEKLSRKTVVVIGASRGLGAALALVFAAAGARVIAVYSRSDAQAEKLRAAASGSAGEIFLEPCDAGDAAACADLRQRLLANYGGIDWLVCSAAPLPLPMRVEAATVERIEAFVGAGLRLVLAPLATLLEDLSGRGGAVLLISSIYVEDAPPIFPHYVALKCAVEGLLRVAVAEYPTVSACIARPDKLLTDMTNTPMARRKAENPAAAALRIVRDAVTALKPGTIAYVK